MNLLVDTNVLIDALKGKRERAKYLASLSTLGFTFCYCSVIIAELYTGISQPDWRTAEEMTRDFLYLKTSAEAARLAGTLRRRYRDHGVAISTPDCLIAALAIQNGIMLLTRNRKDFPMPELRLYPLPAAAQ